MIRIMLDSNIIISGIVFSGNERKLLNNMYSKGLILILNDYIVIEKALYLLIKFCDNNCYKDSGHRSPITLVIVIISVI
jgi:hypothetical protein